MTQALLNPMQAGRSVVAVLEQFAQGRPEAPAVVGPACEIGYGELWRRVESAAARLYRSGVRAGDCAALAMDSSEGDPLRDLPLLYGLAWLGAIVLPLSPDMRELNRQRMMSQLGARWFIAPGAGAPGALAPGAGTTGALAPGAGTTGAGAPPGASPIDSTEFDAAPARAGDAGAPRGDDPERPLLYAFTSGTTGMPKICLATQRQFLASRVATTLDVGLEACDRKLAPSPWPSRVGVRYLCRMLAIGGAFVNADFPESLAGLAALVRDFGVSYVSASPMQMRRLLASDTPEGLGPLPLRGINIGGAFISEADIRACRQRITPNVHVMYASNETGVMAHLAPQDEPDERGKVGRAPPFVEGQVVDQQDRALPPGETGRLRFRAPWAPSAYVDNPEASALHFRDGWFYPGDLGSIDAQGVVRLAGRADEVINFSGLKIMPSEIEAILLAHPDVADAAVAGIPERLAGEFPVAFVVLRRSPDWEALRRFCDERIDSTRMPSIMVSVPGIPRNESGKILRERLRSEYTDRILAHTRVR
ncbi:MAG: acyl--CoA ligase [Burkholderiales bacterium]|nr:acyl--CoA ligase [Burkholderiales bacterium]